MHAVYQYVQQCSRSRMAWLFHQKRFQGQSVKHLPVYQLSCAELCCVFHEHLHSGPVHVCSYVFPRIFFFDFLKTNMKDESQCVSGLLGFLFFSFIFIYIISFYIYLAFVHFSVLCRFALATGSKQRNHYVLSLCQFCVFMQVCV